MGNVRFYSYELVRERTEEAFREHHARLFSLLPYADIQHVGSTAIPGARTKGDLDIQVRVPPERFAEAEAVLAERYARNEGSERTPGFSSFKDDTLEVPLGIQLTAMGGSHDFFSRVRDVLRADAKLLAEYDALKARWEGRPMDAYREEKGAFFEKLLGLVAWEGARR
ncbi:MAG TPA: GrpB family protein [Archangium sp.]|uniref:GrpB family protein n=1 Tax=Archangium sp. TaxID=1872627 RepID=UPI002E365E87|nr:GrpB family protein [Archangium sp.]HEX5752897.1 GrpB family protein [Archangium sp.]